MDNSIIIVDEAHNLTNNEYGEALNMLRNISSFSVKAMLIVRIPDVNSCHF